LDHCAATDTFATAGRRGRTRGVEDQTHPTALLPHPRHGDVGATDRSFAGVSGGAALGIGGVVQHAVIVIIEAVGADGRARRIGLVIVSGPGTARVRQIEDAVSIVIESIRALGS